MFKNLTLTYDLLFIGCYKFTNRLTLLSWLCYYCVVIVVLILNTFSFSLLNLCYWRHDFHSQTHLQMFVMPHQWWFALLTYCTYSSSKLADSSCVAFKIFSGFSGSLYLSLLPISFISCQKYRKYISQYVSQFLKSNL